MLNHLDALKEDLQHKENRKEKAEAIDATSIIKQSIDEMISALKTAIAKLNDDINHHINSNPKLKAEQALLQSIKGVG